MKRAALRRIAVRETKVSRNNGAPQPKLLDPQSSVVLRGLMGALNWGPIMPSETTDISDIDFNFPNVAER